MRKTLTNLLCRSTPVSTCFKDCLNVMVHNSDVYSPIGVKFSGLALLINAYNLAARKKHSQDINKLSYMSTPTSFKGPSLMLCNGFHIRSRSSISPLFTVGIE